MFVKTAVENAVKANNSVDVNEANNGKVVLVAILVTVLILVLLNILIGPLIWNSVFSRLVPGLRKARWYDTLAIAVLFALIVPN